MKKRNDHKSYPLKKKDTSEMNLLSKKPHNSQKQVQKKFSIDDQFFLDFINHDLEVLEQVFSEEQLLEIAEKIDDPQNFQSTSQMLMINDEDFIESQAHKFSEISILTEDYLNNRYNP